MRASDDLLVRGQNSLDEYLMLAEGWITKTSKSANPFKHNHPTNAGLCEYMMVKAGKGIRAETICQ
jgi:hypothetical protein